ncbi:YesK family protein [Peribacillus simplex]|uniref:YesK family protein n=1 Tax=Peribacillus simplex TaxID=1478 RepID=A0AAW7IHI1_9BACI|nr:YesK family protein [Peribacillus simplex]MDM5451076.1 YesK family protein [Peribacillus simplex]
MLGIIMCGLTYLFLRKIEDRTQFLLLFSLGILILVFSLFVIGGFEGMPYGVLSLGVLTLAVLYFFLNRYSLGRKILFIGVPLIIALHILFVFINQVDYRVVDKERLTDDETGNYIEKIEKDTSIVGYKKFKGGEGEDFLLISMGGERKGNTIEVLEVNEDSEKTIIRIRTSYNKNPEPNPYIAVALTRIKSKVVILDTDGTNYGDGLFD